ncbi:DNA replication protein DnaD [Ligilactobacillus sp. WC1T17]|uniref:DNA replication protein DnaD n=1 Tax=Ligilactobacillus ruminis TaxID=1623 RepID=A0ABY1AAA7_9LACO|nr:DNA replication protein DnaD [Ligilactobacillus ruminis]
MEDMILKLLKMGHTTISNLLLENYTKLGLTDSEFIMLLLLIKYQQQNQDVDLEALSVMMNKNVSEIGTLLNNLLVKKIVNLKTTTDALGRQHDEYDYNFLYEKLAKLAAAQKPAQLSKGQNTSDNIFNKFQAEFGRPLSGFEMETIRSWLDEDHYQPDIILLALREAVLNQVYNLKYIDRILISWEKQHVKTPADVERISKRRDLKEPENPIKKDLTGPSIPLYHWSGEANDPK